MVKPQPSLSRRAFAEQVGKSTTVIQRLVKARKIPTDPDGKIPMPAGLIAYAKVRTLEDPAEPEIEVEESAVAEDIGEGEPSETARPSPRAPGRQTIPLDMEQDAVESERLCKLWDARLKELKFKQQNGDLVPLDEVRADARATCETIRNGLLALGPRVALLLEAICARGGALRATAIQATIDDEVNVLVTALFTGRFVTAPAAPPQPIQPPEEPSTEST